VKISHYLVEALDADLRVINKSEYVPTNCWRFRDSPVKPSTMFLVV